MAADPYKYFRIEAHELVTGLAQGLLDLEKRADAELVARLLRYAHTLKGAARIVRHRALADLAHAIEDALAPLRDAPVAQRHDTALALVDQMTAQLATLSAPQPAPAPAAEPVAPRLADAPIPRVDATAIDDALGALANVHALIGRSRGATDPRVAARFLEQADRELREVRRDVEQLRLSSAGTLFTALERTARDAAIAKGRRVAFTGRGGDVRVDAQVLAVLHGALVQLVRNAVAHGIESPGERTAAGKPAEGRVAISVTARGHRITIACEDDGRGLDVAAIRSAARRQGLAGEVSDDPSELFLLLLRGGITTAPDVSELAGRGIGLDVVRDATQALGGDVAVRSVPGAGTTVTVDVPVSASAVTVLRAQAGDRTVAIPQTAVRRLAALRPGDVIAGAGTAGVYFDDALVPYATLGAVLGIAADPRLAIFVDGGAGVAAVAVDRVLGVEETVVRAAPVGAAIDPIVLGLALDAEGQPYAVLEPSALVAAAQRSRGDAVAGAPPPVLPILVVDDSLTTRMLEQSILESAGFAVEVATSAEEALVKLAATTYALMLVDVEMPGMDGFSLISAVRARPAIANLPAILVTSRDAAEDRRRGSAVGADGYVIKSQFDQVELLAMIRRLVPA